MQVVGFFNEVSIIMGSSTKSNEDKRKKPEDKDVQVVKDGETVETVSNKRAFPEEGSDLEGEGVTLPKVTKTTEKDTVEPQPSTSKHKKRKSPQVSEKQGGIWMSP